jgi:AcrR family transcriptional regulator
MKKSDNVKERIIEATIALIKDSKGDIAYINTRSIAEKANVGVGLVNYHFQTKEHLIEICVERIIGNVISSFSPSLKPAIQTPVERLKHIAKLVTDFLIDNPAVSRISILSDFKNPQNFDNTMKSVTGFHHSISNLKIPEKERFLLAFTFTLAIQALFLRREGSKELFGYDVNVKEQRDQVIDLLVDNLFGGFEYE